MTLAEQTEALVAQIHPFLYGHEAEVQSAVIAELLSTWVLGFAVPGDKKATKRVQKEMLEGHIDLVHQLIECQRESAYERILKRN